MIERYTTRPEVVEAARFDGNNGEKIALWCGGDVALEQFDWESPKLNVVRVPTLDGIVRANNGDYVVRDTSNGRFSVMKADKFEEKFHKVGLRQDGLKSRGLDGSVVGRSFSSGPPDDPNYYTSVAEEARRTRGTFVIPDPSVPRTGEVHD